MCLALPLFTACCDLLIFRFSTFLLFVKTILHFSDFGGKYEKKINTMRYWDRKKIRVAIKIVIAINLFKAANVAEEDPTTNEIFSISLTLLPNENLWNIQHRK